MINTTEQLDLIEAEKPKQKRKRCHNRKFEGEQFKVGNKELYPEADLKSGKLSGWDTFEEWWSTCNNHEFKTKYQMEITNEIKSKVMAPYIGAKCDYKWNREDDMLHGKLTPRILESLYYDDGVITHCVIELTPLSAITDEHAIGVAKIAGYEYELTGKAIINYLINPVGFVTVRPEALIEVVEQLREWGYDYKHRLLNGQTLKEAGLAVYKTT